MDKTQKNFLWLVVLTALLLFRFFYGLYCPSVTTDEDYTQTYVIGLKCYTTHTWPYYGPDVVAPETNFKTQIPGALEGLLGALPFYLWKAPESPYFFSNLLSVLALGLFTWYCCKRLPKFPPVVIALWVFLAPWLIHYGAEIINPSYAFIGSVLFFLGFFETVKIFRLGVIDRAWANVFMGFGIAWVMQLHMSWLAFVPFLLYALYEQVRDKQFSSAPFMLLGALPVLALLIPTYWVYGFSTGRDVHAYATGINWANVKDIFQTLARFFAIVSFEMPRFIGPHTPDRIHYLTSQPWMLIPGVLLWFGGFAQVLLLWFFWFVPKGTRKDWNAMRWLCIATFFLLYGCFCLSPDSAASFRLLLLFPVMMLYSFYVYDILAQKPLWRKVGWVFMVCVVIFQIGYAVKSAQVGDSIYAKQKAGMAQALEKNDYTLLEPRREGCLY